MVKKVDNKLYALKSVRKHNNKKRLDGGFNPMLQLKNEGIFHL